MLTEKPYWQTPVHKSVKVGNQIFRYYKEAETLEVVTLLNESGIEKEIRRQPISSYKLKQDKQLQDLFLDFLEDSGLIEFEDAVADA